MHASLVGNGSTPSAQKQRNLLGYYTEGSLLTTRNVQNARAAVRPHLEYAAPVWDPHLLRVIKRVEKVQIFGLKMCLNDCD